MLKLSTRKVIGIATTSVVAMLATLWVSSGVLRSFWQVGVLGLSILTSFLLMGWAKPRSDSKLVAILIILATVVFQLVMFLLLGLKLGFVYNVYNWSLGTILRVFLPTTLLIVGEEILRGRHGRKPEHTSKPSSNFQHLPSGLALTERKFRRYRAAKSFRRLQRSLITL